MGMRVRVLGSAAGGGFPQWNCRCPCCEAARADAALPRSQSSLAVRGSDGRWFLVNASPDVHAQVASLAASPANGMRATPFAAILLTDAEIDHTAGLLLLRESGVRLRVYSTPEVRRALTDGFPVFPVLERYCGVDWSPVEIGRPTRLEGSSLEVEAFAAGGDPPLYLQPAFDVPAIGLTFRDRASGRAIVYAPSLARLDESITAKLSASDCAFVDGTFWHDDELLSLGVGTRPAAAMGHVALDGRSGSLATLARLPTRTILVHVNNTNPILLDDSPERAAVEAAGVEVAYDGLEVDP
jgi:pyrroloquinoline quinone biosynthesis protein B